MAKDEFNGEEVEGMTEDEFNGDEVGDEVADCGAVVLATVGAGDDMGMIVAEVVGMAVAARAAEPLPEGDGVGTELGVAP
jgi:hypothetical protein